MKPKYVHAELLIGRNVRDVSGEHIGHIEEIEVEESGKDWVVRAYHVGVEAFMERLNFLTFGVPILHMLGIRRSSLGYIIPWDQMDLTDPEHPRAGVNKADLKKLE